jgi:hypothetical protein
VAGDKNLVLNSNTPIYVQQNPRCFGMDSSKNVKPVAGAKLKEVLTGVFLSIVFIWIALWTFEALPTAEGVLQKIIQTPSGLAHLEKLVEGGYAKYWFHVELLFLGLKMVLSVATSAFVVITGVGLCTAPKETIGCFALFGFLLVAVAFVLLVLAALGKWAWLTLFGA